MSTDQDGRPRPAWAFGNGRATAIQRPVRRRAEGRPVPLNARPTGWVVGRMPNGELRILPLRWQDFATGNAQFFDPDDPARARLRPLISEDRGRSLLSECANSVLWFEHADVDSVTAFYVNLYPRFTKDCPDGVDRAIKYVCREYGKAFLETPDAILFG